MRTSILLHSLLFVLGLFHSIAWGETQKIERVRFLSVNSAITPATYDYLAQNFAGVDAKTLIVIKMNTPGGLVTTTKDIISLFGNSQAPVAVWITPEGASAASAGAIIASGAHFIFMSPGTNMGAATPIGMGGDIKESDGRKKAINDLTAMVRSLSDQRGRPSAPFEEMIVEAKSFTDREAAKLKIIDGVASTLSDLTATLNGKTIIIQGKTLTLDVAAQVPTEDKPLTLGQKLLDVLANPSLAYFLFLIGIALIYFEFQAPGGYIAGAIGCSFLILAAVAFQVLPLNWGAMGLIVLGVFFLIMEVFITSYGLLSVAGLVSFVMGSLFLFKGEAGFISVDYPVLISSLAAVFISVGFLVWYLYQDQKKQKKNNDFFVPQGEKGVVMATTGAHIMIKVRGEIWKAVAEESLAVGDEIKVMKVDSEHLMLHIKKVN